MGRIEKIKSIDGKEHDINATYLEGNTLDDIIDVVENKIDENTKELSNKADKSEISMTRNKIDDKYYSTSQADSIDKELYYNNFALSGPISISSESSDVIYETSTVISDEFLSNLIEVEFEINGAKLKKYSFKEDGEGTILTFDDYIDFYYYSKKKQVKYIENKFFTFKYYTKAKPITPSVVDIIDDDETGGENFDVDDNTEVKDVFVLNNMSTNEYLNANANGIQSIATNIGKSIGFLSSASNSALSVGEYSSAEGILVLSTKAGKFYNTLNTGVTSNPQGLNGSYGLASHTEGGVTITTQSGIFGHAEGHSTVSDNFASHAEGRKTYSGGLASHAEGSGSIALGHASHASGISSNEYHQIFGNGKEGGLTIEEILNKWNDNQNFSLAIGQASYVGGINSITNGDYSFVHGTNLLVNNENEVSFGKYNLSNNDTIFSVGIGGDNNNRKNALEIKSDGSVYFNCLGNQNLKDYIDALNDKIKSLEDRLESLENK